MPYMESFGYQFVIFILTLFIVIAASRPMKKNVSTGAVITAKL